MSAFDWGVCKPNGGIVLAASALFFLVTVIWVWWAARGFGARLLVCAAVAVVAAGSLGTQLASAHRQESVHAPAVGLCALALGWACWAVIRRERRS